MASKTNGNPYKGVSKMSPVTNKNKMPKQKLTPPKKKKGM